MHNIDETSIIEKIIQYLNIIAKIQLITKRGTIIRNLYCLKVFNNPIFM